MDKLTRINNLNRDMRKNLEEKTVFLEEIEKLQLKVQSLDNEYSQMQNLKRVLEKKQYEDKKLRKKIVVFTEKSDFPEIAIALEPYINIIWVENEIPDEILDAYAKMETLLREKSWKITGLKEICDNIHNFFVRDDEDGGLSNDN